MSDWFTEGEEEKLKSLTAEFEAKGCTHEQAIREAEQIVYSKKLQTRPSAVSHGVMENEYLITFKLDNEERALFITTQFSMIGNKFDGNELYKLLKAHGKQRTLGDFK